MNKIVSGICLCILSAMACVQAETKGEKSLQRLVEGNQRYISDKSEHPNRTTERRQETAKMQEPFAVILGCSDSRVAPEILFDQGIGDLFIIRVAGNVAGDIELGSAEYATVHLHAPLVVVLGHENCGAVKAVLDDQIEGIEAIASLIEPAVDKAEKMSGDTLENAVKQNVLSVVKQLQAYPPLKKLIDKKALLIKGGYYNFHTATVTILP
ncbi:MAG TPA: carbonic anhydrase [Rhabdochlamydiaceae bacterium]|jgi:carbonic anhydrase